MAKRPKAIYQPAEGPKGLAKAGSRHYDRAMDASRRDVTNQVRALNASINKNLRHIANLVKAGTREGNQYKLDQAAKVCVIVAKNRARILDLIPELEVMAAMVPEPEPDPKHRTPKTRVIVKEKRYKLFDKD